MPGWWSGEDTQFVSSFESLGDELRGLIWERLTKKQRCMMLKATKSSYIYENLGIRMDYKEAMLDV